MDTGKLSAMTTANNDEKEITSSLSKNTSEGKLIIFGWIMEKYVD